MSSGAEERRRLFDRGVEALERVLVPQFFEEHPEFQGRYMCPICCGWLSCDALTIEPPSLTLEDVPPKAFPGPSSKLALTCSECNHRSGSLWEADLKERERHRSFLRGNSPDRTAAVATIEGVPDLNAWAYHPGSGLYMEIDQERNDPGSLAYLQQIPPEGSFTLRTRRGFHDADVRMALLKAAFLAVFAALGYRWSLGKGEPVQSLLVSALSDSSESVEPPPIALGSWFASQESRRILHLAHPEDCLLVEIGPNAVLLPSPTTEDGFLERLDRVYGTNAINPAPVSEVPWPKTLELRLDLTVPVGGDETAGSTQD